MTTPKVQYTYANGSGNQIRPTRTTYPDGRELNLDYGSAGGMDDLLSRVGALVDDDGVIHLTDSSYLGLGTPVITDYTQPDVMYTLVGTAGGNDPDTGDIYRGLDRFGRVKDAYWRDYGASTDAARIQYGYDRSGNRTYRADPVAVANSAPYEELYGYDAIQRLKTMDRGTLNGTKTALTTKSFDQCWTLDPTGNWKGFRQDDTGDGAWDLIQARTANPVNEITGITNSVGSAWVTPAYNAAGNMTTIPQSADPTQSYTATYDAWNRLVKLTDGANTVAEYEYDARNYRTVQKSYTAGTLSETRHFYYSSNWQVLEERVGTSPDSANAERQFVWGRRYIDDLVLRDRDTNGNGTLDERLYALQDGNWNVIALTDTSGDVQERYAYSPFGWPTFLSSNMIVRTSSTVDNDVLFTGQRFDSTTKLHLFRRRWFDSISGRFISRDPLDYPDGPNSYAGWFVPQQTDPSGNQARRDPRPKTPLSAMNCKLGDFCGPDMTGVLMKEMRHAVDHYNKEMEDYRRRTLVSYSLNALMFMRSIGYSLDWWDPVSDSSIIEDTFVMCPSGIKCSGTYEICGRCVDDHFMGHVMYGFWMALLGFDDLATQLTGNTINWTEHFTWDPQHDVAGYYLGRGLASKIYKSFYSSGSLCNLLKNNVEFSVTFDMAAVLGSKGPCKLCPCQVKGGVDKWEPKNYPDLF